MPPKKSVATTKGAGSKAPAKKAPAAKGAAKPAAKKPEPVKAPPKEEPKEEEPAKRKTITQKEIAKVLVEDLDGDIRGHGKAVLVIDNENKIAGRFLPYSGANVLEASDPAHMGTERLRLALMGAVRFGKPLAIDFGECGPEMIDILETKFDDIQKGLLEKAMNRDICKRDNYESLLKEGDEENMKVASYYDFENECAAKYIFMIIMTPGKSYPPTYTKKFYQVTVDQQ